MATVGTPYQELIQAIADYYGSGSDQWLQVAQYGTTADDFIDIVNQLPNYQVVTNKAGDIISYQKIDALPTVNSASVVDSNIVNAPVKVSTPATVTTVEGTGEVVATKGVATSSGLQFMTKSVLPAIAAAGVGITLGKTIDSVLYNANPDFWDSIGMETLNPETWSMITADMSGSTGEQALATAFNLLYGIDPNTDKSQAYIDQNAYAYMVAYMLSQGVFDEGGQTSDLTPNITHLSNVNGVATNTIYYTYRLNDEVVTSSISGGILSQAQKATAFLNPNHSASDIFYITASDESSSFIYTSYTHNDKTVYYSTGSLSGPTGSQMLSCVPQSTLTSSGESTDASAWDDIAYIAWTMIYGEDIPTIDGIGEQVGATQFNPSTISDPSNINDVLTALQTQYPDLFTNAVIYPVLQPDGTTTNYTYVPIALPNGTSATDTQPTASGQDITQTTPAYDPTTMPSTVWDDIWEILHPSSKEIDTPTDTTGDGDTPAIVTPTGSASALWKIYNPSQSQLDDFGAWLWSSDFVDQLLKVFSDPMQAIIGLHKIFVNPPISGSGAIKVGYLVSDASANYVSGQYVDVDCGTVKLDEYFNNVFDYENTTISIYLPFSGIHKLDVNDVMRGEISVIYHVDVLTGACLIDVKVMRDLAGGVLYTFSGNCAVQYPVSSGSYVGIVTGLLGIAGGIAGTIASGGMLAPMLMGAGASIGHMHTDVSHSGNISSNAGAMGAKKPYLIIERPQTKTPPTAVTIEGLPQNDIVTLSELTGYVKVKTARYDGLSCTSNELDILRGLLETGVYVS